MTNKVFLFFILTSFLGLKCSGDGVFNRESDTFAAYCRTIRLNEVRGDTEPTLLQPIIKESLLLACNPSHKNRKDLENSYVEELQNLYLNLNNIYRAYPCLASIKTAIDEAVQEIVTNQCTKIANDATFFNNAKYVFISKNKLNEMIRSKIKQNLKGTNFLICCGTDSDLDDLIMTSLRRLPNKGFLNGSTYVLGLTQSILVGPCLLSLLIRRGYIKVKNPRKVLYYTSMSASCLALFLTIIVTFKDWKN